MAGTIKTNAVQLGDSATATQNFTLRTNADGTATLARGNVGATTQDVLTIAADGTVKLPASVTPVFSVYQSTLQTVPNITSVKALFQTKEYDPTNAFDTSTSRFQPSIAGWYQLNGTTLYGVTAPSILTRIYKNGAAFKDGAYSTAYSASVSSLVYMNGTTDYVEIYTYHSYGAPANTVIGSSGTWFNGILIART